MEKVEVTLLTTEHDGKLYGAGSCFVTIGTAPPMQAVALRYGDEKYITTEPAAVDWLTKRGLPFRIATELVDDAVAEEKGKDRNGKR
jgi:hypothetical protein